MIYKDFVLQQGGANRNARHRSNSNHMSDAEMIVLDLR